MKTSIKRVVGFVLMCAVVIMLPWWISVIALMYFAVRIPAYLELIFFGFLFDMLYAPTLGWWYPATTLSTVLLLVLTFARTRIRT